RREGDLSLDDLGHRGGDRLQRIGFVRPTLGAAEMREQNDLAAFVGDFPDRRRDAFDARRIGHPAVLRRNVKVDAQQHTFAGDFGVIERAKRFAHISAPKASEGSDAPQFPAVLSGPRKRATSLAASVRAGAFALRLWTPAFAGVTPNP